MRKLTVQSRMQANSIAEIRQALDDMAHLGPKVRVGNRPASEGHVVNAAVLVLWGMSPERRTALLRGAYHAMNELLEREREAGASELAAILERHGLLERDGEEPEVIPGEVDPRARRRGNGRAG